MVRSKEDDIKKQCFNAVRDHDPPCKFGTTLYSINSSHPENSRHCIAEAHSSNRIGLGFGLGGGEETRRAARRRGRQRDEYRGHVSTRMVRRGLFGVRRVQFVSVYRHTRDKTTPSWMHEGLFFTDCRGVVDTEEDEKIWTRIKIGWCPRRVLKLGRFFLVNAEEMRKRIRIVSSERSVAFVSRSPGASQKELVEVSSLKESGKIELSSSIRSSVSNDDNKREVEINVRAYGGMPTQDNGDYPEWKYKYASAAVWDANFTKCTYSVENCRAPYPSDHTCVMYDCTSGKRHVLRPMWRSVPVELP